MCASFVVPKNFVVEDGDIALDPSDDAARWGRSLAFLGLVLPDQISTSGIQRLNNAMWVGQVHDPVVDQRRRLLRPVFHGP